MCRGISFQTADMAKLRLKKVVVGQGLGWLSSECITAIDGLSKFAFLIFNDVES